MAEDAMVILKDIADKNNATLGWDATTKNVKINDTEYTPEQLTGMGGKLENGRWMLSTDAANKITGAPAATPAVDPMQSIIDAITNSNKGFLDTQIATAGANRDSAIAELKASLNKAITEGQMSVLEAKEAYEKQLKVIDQTAYTDSEQSQVQMQEMGIQNSQQGMGMIASDQARKQSLVNDNIKNRDNRILQINERIKSLSSDADIQLNKINADYNTNVMNATGQANYNTSNAIADLKSKDYFIGKEQDFQKWLQDDSQAFTSEENQANRDFQSKEAATEREWKSTEAGLERDHAITMQNNEFIHDKQMTSIKFQNDLTAMAQQFGYSSQLADQNSKNAIAEYEAKVDKEYEMVLKESNNKLLSEYAKYNDPNSIEYKTYAAQVAKDTQMQLDGVMNEALSGTMVDLILNKPGSFNKSNVDDLIDNMGGWDKFRAMDEFAVDIYDKTLDAIDKGTSKEAFIKSLHYLGGEKELINKIVEPMYDNKEWADVYEELKNIINKGTMNQ